MDPHAGAKYLQPPMLINKKNNSSKAKCSTRKQTSRNTGNARIHN